MHKITTFIAAMAILITSLSAAVDSSRVASLGKEAPEIMAQRADSTLSLQSLRGKWVILSFWSATDAQSRLDQHRIAQLSSDPSDSTVSDRSNADSNVEVVCVNLDNNEGLTTQTIRLDNLDASTQWCVNNPADIKRLQQAYALDGSPSRTFVIDPEGRLHQADPTPAVLSSLLASR